MTPTEQLILATQELVDAIAFDDCGALIGGKWMGGNGGLLSRETIAKADAARRAIEAARKREAGYRWHLTECEQIAGKALGYPWYKDDPITFPGATEADGVCVGEHVGDTIVQELANAYLRLRHGPADGDQE